jgi:membrane protease YdiL (CAAX protease family)
MNTPYPPSQIGFGILLLIGSIILPFLIKTIRKESHLAPKKTECLQHRAWSNRTLYTLLISWLSLYLLAAITGLFFYEDQLPTVRLILTYIIYTLIGAQIIHTQRTQSSTQPLGLAKKNLPQLRWALPLYLAFLPLLSLIAILNQLFLTELLQIETEHQAITQQMTQWNNPLNQLYILTAILIAPLYEEILFRGVLLPKLIQKTGLTNALIITSLLFAALHFHLPALLPLFALSILLSLVYWWSGSLWNCIAIHMLFNAGSIAFLIAKN